MALTSGMRSRVTLGGTIKSNINIVFFPSVSSSALTTMARRRNSINPPYSANWSVQVQEHTLSFKFNISSEVFINNPNTFSNHCSTAGSDVSPLATDHRNGPTGTLVKSTGGKVNLVNCFMSLSVRGEYAGKILGGPHLQQTDIKQSFSLDVNRVKRPHDYCIFSQNYSL